MMYRVHWKKISTDEGFMTGLLTSEMADHIVASLKTDADVTDIEKVEDETEV